MGNKRKMMFYCHILSFYFRNCKRDKMKPSRAMPAAKHQSCCPLLCGLIPPSAAKLVFVALVTGLLCSFCHALDIALDELSQEWPQEFETTYYNDRWGLANAVAASTNEENPPQIKQTVFAGATLFGFQAVYCSKTGILTIPSSVLEENGIGTGYYRIKLDGHYEFGIYNWGKGIVSGHFGAARLEIAAGFESEGYFHWRYHSDDIPPQLSDLVIEILDQAISEILLVVGVPPSMEDITSITDIVSAANGFDLHPGDFTLEDVCFIKSGQDNSFYLRSSSVAMVDCIGLAGHVIIVDSKVTLDRLTLEGPLVDVPPRLEITPAAFNERVTFGQVVLGQVQSIPLTLHNVGGDVLDGNVVLQQSGSVFGVTGDTTFSLSSHSFANVNLSFVPDDVKTFAAKLLVTDDQGQGGTMHQIHLCGAGIGPVIKDSPATNLSTYFAHPGETITFRYEISSPFDTEADAWLGATIRHHENRDFWHSDAVRDKPIKLAPGLTTYSREFTLRDDAPPGWYDVIWGIHSGSTVGAGTIWHILPRLDVLEIRGLIEAEATMGKSYYEPGETADLTVHCKDHYGNTIDVDTVTYVTKQGDRIFQGPLPCSPTTEVGQYQATIYTQDLDRGLYTISTIIVKSGYHTANASTLLNVGLQEVDLMVEPDSVYITASKDTNPTYDLAVLNGGWQVTNVSVSKSGQLADWISLPESQFTLDGGSSRSYSFAINVPSSASGVRQGTLTFTAGERTETVDVTLKVTSFSPGDYFDRICDGGTVDSSTSTQYSCTLDVSQQDLEAWREGFVLAGIYARAGEVERRGIVQLVVNDQYVADDDVERSGHGCEWLFWTADVLGTSNTFVLRAKPGDDVGVHFDAMEFRIKFYAGDPDLRTTKQVDRQTLYIGETATVTVTIENVGSNVGNVLYAPDDPRFSDSLPEGLEFVSGSLHGSIHEFLPAPEPGSKDELQYAFRATIQGTHVLPVFSFPYEKKPYEGVAEYESQSNTAIVEVLPLEPTELQVQIGGLEEVYSQGESMSGLSIHVSADEPAIAGATILYAIKCDGDEVLSGRSTTNSSGQFVPDDLNAPVIPGDYVLEATASKVGYIDGESSSSFTVRDSTAPTVPTLLYPLNGSHINDARPELRWIESGDPGSGVLHYIVQIDTDLNFAGPAQVQVTEPCYRPTSGFANGRYYWRVKAIDNAQNPSDWSSTYLFTVEAEKTPPPKPNSVQAARDTIIQMHITDSGSGVEYDGTTVTIRVEGDLIYDGASEYPEGVYDSTGNSQPVKGVCRRTGTAEDYTFLFQPSTLFDYEQKVDVQVSATDKVGNDMTEIYYFYTVMREFGKNVKVNSDTGALVQNHPATATDPAGNIWVVWDQTTATGDTDIYMGRLQAGGSTFGPSLKVTDDADYQRNPAIAIDNDDTIYVVWQGDDPSGRWDIFASTLADGTNWSSPVKVNGGDPNNESDQTSPAIAIDGNNKAYVVWEDNQAGNKDIWVATSANGTTWSEQRITGDSQDQTEPTIAIDASDVVFIAWTDWRNQSTTGMDIYGAPSDEGSWNNVPLVVTASNQSSPVVGVSSDGVIHLLWVDDANGDDDIFYGNDTSGLPLTATSIVDESSTMQSAPAIAVVGTGASTKVFTCWQDSRNVVGNNGDTDIYFAESGQSFGTNVLVNDDTGTNTQMVPAIGIDNDGNPYVVWVDDRNGNNDIYYAGATAVGPALLTTITTTPAGNTIVELNGTNTGYVDDATDVLVEIPAGATPSDITVTISEIRNLPELPSGAFGVYYDFGPSGTQFSAPATITIPHATGDCPGLPIYQVYWYNTQIGAWSTSGVTNVKHLDDTAPNIASGLHAVQFDITHFTAFGASAGAAPASGGGGGGGGCSVLPLSEGNIAEFVLPYVAFVIVLLAISWVDARRRRANIRDRRSRAGN